MKILVCGSRGRVSEWDYQQLFNAFDDLGYSHDLFPSDFFIIHGGCPNSPDESAQSVAGKLEAVVKSYPADWNYYGKKAGYVRNIQMLKEGKPDLVIAQWDGKSRGTLNMITEATAWGVPVRILPPNTKDTP